MFVHVLCVEVPLHRSSLVAFMSPGMFKHAKDIKVLPLTSFHCTLETRVSEVQLKGVVSNNTTT